VNKGDFATVLAERTELSKAEAHRALDGILSTLTEVMADHDEVSFSGWGKFSAQRRKGRDAHDPRNPQRTIHISPGYVPKFKAGSILKREIQAALPAPPQFEAAGPAEGATAGNGVAGTTAGNGVAGWLPLGKR
jgi:DNA-binding protein HU-beta